MATSASESGFVDNWQGERTLAECTLHMLTTQDDCNVHFRVGPNEETVSAHRFILISRSCVFHAMFCGPLAEQEIIRLPDVTKDPFMEFLKFLYTDDCSLSADNVTVILYLSKKYAVERLQKRCLSYLEEQLTPSNACVIFDQAYLFDEKNLQDKALDVIKQNGDICLESHCFREMSKRSLDMVLSSFDSHLEAVFKAALSWAGAECERTGRDPNPSNKGIALGDSIYTIGFTGFKAKQFVKIVIPAQVLSENDIVKLMSHLTCSDVDVEPFRVINKMPKTHQIDMYQRSHSPVQTEIDFVESKQVCDRFSVKPSFDMFLKRLVLAPMEGTYEVTIEHTSKGFETVKYVSKVTSSDLECSILIPAMTECDIWVVHESGDCPSELMTELETILVFDKCYIFVERKDVDSYRTKGMVKSIYVQNSSDLDK